MEKRSGGSGWLKSSTSVLGVVRVISKNDTKFTIQTKKKVILSMGFSMVRSQTQKGKRGDSYQQGDALYTIEKNKKVIRGSDG